jgi:AGCS family alanine or glycine:cation symporter
MQEIVSTINSWIWSPALIYLLLGVGLFFSILTRFVQARMFREMIRLLFSSKESDKGISSFQALSVSLSGRVGTGNIAGVAAAIGFGGPSAVFWMWVVAFLGSATAYVESTLGQIYKEVDEGQYRGGPAFYFEKALGLKWYAWIFAISTIIATGMLLPGVQSNAIGNAAAVAFGSGSAITSPLGVVNSTNLITGTVVVIVLGFIIFGGVKRIAHFTQVVVPFMALAYIAMALIVIAINITELPNVFALIFNDIFNPMAMFGGAIFWGVKRGVFSNEAGQGTGPHAAAASEVQHPAQQGLVQAFSVYVDTLFVCSATAFMILITGTYNVLPEGGTGFVVQNLPAATIIDSPAFTQFALESTMGDFGRIFVAVALFFFAFTTLLAYYYIAETNAPEATADSVGILWFRQDGQPRMGSRRHRRRPDGLAQHRWNPAAVLRRATGTARPERLRGAAQSRCREVHVRSRETRDQTCGLLEKEGLVSCGSEFVRTHGTGH